MFSRLDRAFLRVAGPDAVSFLDSLLTQDVTRLDAAEVLYAALLTPQGKVVTDMFLWPDEEHDEPSVLIELDPARADDLLRRLTMYKLRAKVAVERAHDLSAVYHRQAHTSDNHPDPRFPDGALGWRDYLPLQSELDDAAAMLEARRLALGVPDLARDAQSEEVFAGEALLDELNGVDFQKGCFVGQENVSRMKRRATTRKKFCPVVFDGPAPAYGAKVTAGAAELGQIRTGMGGRAIALLRLDRALAAQQDGVKIEAEGRQMRLDPPSWLILPPREGAPSGTPD